MADQHQANDRFTAWLSVSERDALRAAAEMMGASQNYIVRLALRDAFGLPLSEYERSQLSHLSRVTNTVEIAS